MPKINKGKFKVMCGWSDADDVVYKDNMSLEAANRLKKRLEQRGTYHIYYVLPQKKDEENNVQ